MAKFKIVGIDAAFSQFGEIARESEGIAKMCVYDGARVVADAVKQNIRALPERDPKKFGTQKNKVRGATPAEKQAMLNGMGIAAHRVSSGSVNTVIGFDGYDGNPTKSYPKGHAISMIARTIESGSSWLTATPFMKRAIASSQSAAASAMAARFDEEISKRGK